MRGPNDWRVCAHAWALVIVIVVVLGFGIFMGLKVITDLVDARIDEAMAKHDQAMLGDVEKEMLKYYDGGE